MIAAFSTVFLLFALGFAVQRLRPLADVTLAQLSALVVNLLLPLYLFYATATGVTLDSLRVAPALIGLGIAIPVASYPLATLILRPAGVGQDQRSAFRLAVLMANTGFLGFPICQALFGQEGLVYAVLYDFGTTLVITTLGIWELSGGRSSNWRPLLINPLAWGVVAGLGWALAGWPFPDWLAAPLETLSRAALPVALLVGGAQVGRLDEPGLAWWRQLTGLALVRLVLVPLAAGLLLLWLGWSTLPARVVVLEAGMPAGLTIAILARTYGADAGFAAAATLWTTMAAMVTLPLVALLVGT